MTNTNEKSQNKSCKNWYQLSAVSISLYTSQPKHNPTQDNYVHSFQESALKYPWLFHIVFQHHNSKVQHLSEQEVNTSFSSNTFQTNRKAEAQTDKQSYSLFVLKTD